MSLRFKERLRISAGFCLLIVWFAVVNGPELLLTILGAAAIHEMGHFLMLRLLGAKIMGLRIGILGAVLEADCRRLSYGKELAVVLAGPGMNLLSACLLSGFQTNAEIAIGVHLILGAFNLLPIRPLDGGQALYLLVTWIFGPLAGELCTRWLSAVTALSLTAGICWLMRYTGGSLWLLPAAMGLLGIAGREWFGKEQFL